MASLRRKRGAPHPCPLPTLKLPSTSYLHWNLCTCGDHWPECPSLSHPQLVPSYPTLFFPRQAVRVPPAPRWVQSALTALCYSHSCPSCVLHWTPSHLRVGVTSCFSLPSHQGQAEKMLKNVGLVSHARRGENMLEITPRPCLLPSGISSGDVSRCAWDSRQLSETGLEHPST